MQRRDPVRLRRLRLHGGSKDYFHDEVGFNSRLDALRADLGRDVPGALLTADGSVRDTFHLSPARAVLLGRESGDWVFPYDPTMSGRHAEIRSEDAEFFVHDAGSRNGVA